MSKSGASDRPTVTVVHSIDSPEEEALVGMQLSERFHLLQVIGIGGQAWVYLSRDERTSEIVALKLLRPELRHDDTSLRRFKREREELARLPHPNVVRVLDHGVDDRVGPWIAMEYLHGETLAAALARHALPSAPDAVALLIAVLEPVGILHAEGRAHRDLKPSNIFLERNDGHVRPLLLDFGVCFRPSGGSGSDRLTQEGEAVGTLGYLAHEALYSTPTRVALLDVWAAAAILVEMVTGARLVPRDHGAVPVLRSAEEWEESLSEFANRSDAKLMRITAASLSVDLADRPPDARVLSSLLRGWLGGTSNRGIR